MVRPKEAASVSPSVPVRWLASVARRRIMFRPVVFSVHKGGGIIHTHAANLFRFPFYLSANKPLIPNFPGRSCLGIPAGLPVHEQCRILQYIGAFLKRCFLHYTVFLHFLVSKSRILFLVKSFFPRRSLRLK